MVRVNFTGPYGHNLQLNLFSAWSAPIEGQNASRVNVQVLLVANQYAAIFGSHPRTLWINVGGIAEQIPVDVGISQGQTKVLLQKDYTIQHNADGTKEINISTALDVNVGGYGIARADFNLALRPIARASKGIDVRGVIGSPIVFNIERKNESFKHSIAVKFGEFDRVITTDKVDTSYTWTPPLEMCSQLPNSTSGEGQVTYITYKDDKEIGRGVRKITLSVPDSLKPTLGEVQLVDNNPATAKILKQNVFVRLLSNVSISLTNSAGTYGSTIVGYDAQIVDKPYRVYSRDGNFGNLNFSGSAKVRVKVVDSRGRESESKDISIEVLDYHSPQINIDARRVGANLDQIQVVRNAKIAPLIIDGVQRNVMKLRFRVANFGTEAFSEDNGPARGDFTTIAQLVESPANLGKTYPSDKSFVVVATIEDSFTAGIESKAEVPTRLAVRSEDRNGMGVLKVRERGALDVGGDIYSNNKPIQQHQLTQNSGVAHYKYGADLNDEKISGIFFKNGTEANNPAKQYGFLVVLKSNNETFQVYFPTIDTAPPFKRTFFKNKWGEWSSFTMSNSEQSAIKRTLDWPWKLNTTAVRVGNVVTLSITRSTKAIIESYENGMMVEKMPEGFRPATDVTMVVTANASHNTIGNSMFYIFSNGDIRFTNGINREAVWTGTVTYLTSDPMPK